MSEILPIPLADLLIDAENPRLPQPNVGQRDALRAIASHQGTKLLVLSRDIVRHGLNPADLSIVMPFKDGKQYIVLEGNRRLTALRALENPEFLVDAVKAGLLAQIRRLSKQYQNAPIESASCVVVNDREEARHWIELRHTGENQGAGIVRWETHEKDRFQARSGKLEIDTQALDFLESRGHLTPETRRAVPARSFRRLLGTPEVRDKLGIEVRTGTIYLLANEKAVAKVLAHLANDLASGEVRTQDIYTKPQRIQYANSLPPDMVVAATLKSGHGAPIGSLSGERVTEKRGHEARVPRLRDKLIPRDCILNITDPRLKQMEAELRKLSLEDFSNAVSVLFRVFLELSADAYIDRVGLPKGDDGERVTLTKKLSQVTEDLLNRKKLSKQQAKPVRRACETDSFLAPSVTLMNNYVHNQHVFPAPGDLRAHWNSLQPFVVAVWAL